MTKLPKIIYNKVWLLTNTGIPWSIHRTRKEARVEAERMCGDPWVKCKRFMEIRKVHLVEDWE